MARKSSTPPLRAENRMMVLSRQRGQEFVIRGITIRILDARDGQVQIGIAAPRAIRLVGQEGQARQQTQPIAEISRRPLPVEAGS